MERMSDILQRIALGREEQIGGRPGDDRRGRHARLTRRHDSSTEHAREQDRGFPHEADQQRVPLGDRMEDPPGLPREAPTGDAFRTYKGGPAHESDQRSQVQQPGGTQPGDVCQLCRGLGWRNPPYPQIGKAMPCECKQMEKAEQQQRRLISMCDLDSLAAKTFDTFDDEVPGVQEAFLAAVEFAMKPRGWLVLVGQPGCGKTHLAAAVSWMRLSEQQKQKQFPSVYFASVPDLLETLKASFGATGSDAYDQLFRQIRTVDLLVLDDLGTNQRSEWAEQALFQIINYRYNAEVPTIFTANLEGMRVLSERVRSRLSDTGLVIRVEMKFARDYRPYNGR